MGRSAFVLLASLCACHGAKGEAAPDAGAARPDAGEAAERTAAAASARPRRAHGPAPCRVIEAKGDVHAAFFPGFGPHTSEHLAHGAESGGATDDAALAADAELPGDAWIVAGDGARVVVKDPRSARETTFVGPARARACVEARDEAWLAGGRFESSSSGEALGAEEWIVTPLGVVRYVAAKLAIEVTAKGTSASLATGAAFYWSADDVRAQVKPAPTEGGAPSPPRDTTEAPWSRLSPGVVALAWSKPSVDASRVAAARDAVTHCVDRADRARDLARALLDRDGGALSGAMIADEVRARRLARASCAVASIRVRLLADVAKGADVVELESSLTQARMAWSRLPLREERGAESGTP